MLPYKSIKMPKSRTCSRLLRCWLYMHGPQLPLTVMRSHMAA